MNISHEDAQRLAAIGAKVTQWGAEHSSDPARHHLHRALLFKFGYDPAKGEANADNVLAHERWTAAITVVDILKTSPVPYGVARRITEPVLQKGDNFEIETPEGEIGGAELNFIDGVFRGVAIPGSEPI